MVPCLFPGLLSSCPLCVDVKVLVSKGVHSANQAVKQNFITVTSSQEKIQQLFNAVERGLSRGYSVLIFCKSAKSVEKLQQILEAKEAFKDGMYRRDARIKELEGMAFAEESVEAMATPGDEHAAPCTTPKAVATLHGNIHPSERRQLIADFQNGTTRLLISTDLIARGWDPAPTLKLLLVQWDFARNIPEYLHRLGRLGRLGQNPGGRMISFVGGRGKRLTELLKVAQNEKKPLDRLMRRFTK